MKLLASAGTMAGALIHELKNPLGVIHLNLQLISEQINKGDVPDKSYLNKKIDVLIKQSDTLNRMMADFLDLIKEKQLKLEKTDIIGIISDIENEYSALLQNKGISFIKYFDKKNIFLICDRMLIKQAVVNIINNAAEALSASGRQDKTIYVKAGHYRNFVRIEITDSGPGISSKMIGKIFNAYFTTKPSGTGLGLPLTKRIIDMHGGTITVNSELGAGTQVLIDLPRKR